jgi:hypothetical protein
MSAMTVLAALGTRILSVLGFYLVVSPLACLMRIFYDPLNMKWDSSASTYRVMPKGGYRPDLSRTS